MRLSVVVPAYNEEKLLAETLQQIAAATESFRQRGWETEQIVCDNNSSDRTAAIARAGGARVVFEPVNQIARARNAGARVATGAWLIFIDADSHPSPALFAAVATHIEGGRCLAGGCTVRMRTRDPLRLFVNVWNTLSVAFKWMAGSFIFCEADAFRQLGGFTETLYASEEIEFSRRARALARRQHKDTVIVRGHPILTSARKLHLYTRREYWTFFRQAIFSGGRSLRRRDHCAIWYDGRR